MDKRLRIAGIIGALIISIVIITSPTQSIPIPEPASKTGNESIEVIATNLEKPRSIAITEDKIFVTEKIGRLRVVQDNHLLDDPLITLRTANVFDGGLLGVATHPDFSNNHYLYVFYTYEDEAELWNKIIRITESDNKAKDVVTILDKIPGSRFSNGGFLKFGPDEKLYVSTGSVSDSSHFSQDLNALAGKILRLNDDGTIPEDNPFSNSPVFAYGFRNPQGMAWDDSGNLYVTDLGPTKNDEINLVKAGKNYGWPEVECSGDKNFVDALVCYDPGLEPGGIIIYSGDKFPLKDHLIVASLRAFNLYEIDLDDISLKSQQSILGGLGRIRDVNQGPDGSLYLITSNTDGKGFPDSLDDRLLRIRK